jgi:SNF2 family DNA or RNA helicase
VDEIIQNGEKVVIFSVFKETLNVLQDKLRQYNPLLCTGDIKDNIISENINAFQTSDTNKVMLCTTAKMGVGITLTAATNAIFIDSTWTQASNLQCEDRIYRIGSEKPVFIYYLWAANTIDEHIKEIVEDKSLVGDYVVDNIIPPQLSERLRAIIMDLANS